MRNTFQPREARVSYSPRITTRQSTTAAPRKRMTTASRPRVAMQPSGSGRSAPNNKSGGGTPNAGQSTAIVAPPTIATIQQAQRRITPYVHKTPVISCTAITAMTRFKSLHFKCENLQKTGAFKIRGATNAVLAIKERTPQVHCFVTHSSGNHGQAVALACKLTNEHSNAHPVEAHVVMPSNCPSVKAAAVKEYGGIVHLCKPVIEARQGAADRVMELHGGSRGNEAVFIHPYNNTDVMSGQGTLGLEILEQLNSAKEPLDAVIVPVGGGGMLAGVSTAIKAKSPNTKVFAAEPAMADDARRSFLAGSLQPHQAGHPNTIADAVLTTMAPATFRAMQKNVDGVLTVSEAEIAWALRLMFERCKMVLEPTAAVGVAVALRGFPELEGCKNVCVVLCGGNVELERLPKYFAQAKSNPFGKSKM